jgi:hypothetical protein
MGLKIKPVPGLQNQPTPGPLWCLKIDLPFLEISNQGLTDGPENQTLSRASKSTHSGALKSTSRGLQMHPHLALKSISPVKIDTQGLTDGPEK